MNSLQLFDSTRIDARAAAVADRCALGSAPAAFVIGGLSELHAFAN